MSMIGAVAGDTDNVAFVIGFTAGGVAIATIIGLWIKYRIDKNKKEGKDG
jgi:hypothetical protein